ncbi:DNA topoisomerase 1 [Seminavis robusta]|uniref:DNA topoisomerase n=1 Tax=Seminavis robusta TaxID=568900 RepID=A0A9N8HLU9_9STRA|nr:DNA topoisomerase 1 [Seminavis robusta]|eukprot:Sro843_g209820.1 DNA topoisomerase 1 (1367) ;mRNA; r:18690-22870
MSSCWALLLSRSVVVAAHKRPWTAFVTSTRQKPLITSARPISTRSTELLRPSTNRPFAFPLFAKSKSTTTAKSGRPYRLMIVESPSKCRTIEKILQKHVEEQNLDYDFVVTSCYGHIRNLPKNQQQIREAKYLSTGTTTSTSATSKKDASFPYSIVGVDLEHDYQPTYVLLPGKESLVQELQDLTQHAQHVYLATDPDREGEAIAWHLQQVLSLQHENKSRLSFSEITPRAIVGAVESDPTQLNHRLVAAQETRRILDRLAGFTVSPILWKKIAPGLSAGRVQSVGMALVVQRERERLQFTPLEYWNVQGNFTAQELVLDLDLDNNDLFAATLVSVNGTSLVAGKADLVQANASTTTSQGKLPPPQPKPNKRLLTQSDARELATQLLEDPTNTEWHVQSVSAKERFHYPPDPFKTSTLQQESNQRLGMSVAETMSTAQKLYEAGWISYMRTDATHLSQDASAATVAAVTELYGPHNVAAAREQQKKSNKKKKAKQKSASDKVAQEAHEAIRPAIQPDGTFASPTDVTALSDKAVKLYQLIFRRTLASRMPPQKTNQTTIVLEGTSSGETTVEFRTTGSVVLEPGFTLSWNRGGDNNNNKELPALEEGQVLACHGLDPSGHTTQPPPRYTEASLVKELEALGVGRPSTYAGVVQILRDRAYVGSPASVEATPSSSKRAATGAAMTAQRAAGGGDMFGARGPLAPSLSAFVVTSLLEEHCPTYVDPSFTARMEENLDRIAHGHDDDSEDSDDGDDDQEEEVDVAQQRVAYLNEFYAGEGGLAAQIKLIDDNVEAEDARRARLPALDTSENSEEPDLGIYIGPWGPYIQQKDPGSSTGPLKAPLPPGLATDLSSITPDTLAALVRVKHGNGTILGQHPEDGRNIRLRVGRFGAYLQWGESDEEGTTTHSLPKKLSSMRNLQVPGSGTIEDGSDDMPTEGAPSDAPEDLTDMLGITLEVAIGYCGLPRTVTTLEDKPITAAIGPYGPYLKYNNSYVSLHARDGDVLTIDGESAVTLVKDGIINKKSGPGRGVLAELGEKDGAQVTVKSGRFGAYLNWRKVNAKLPSEYVDEPDNTPLELAWDLIQSKAGAPSTKKKSGRHQSSPDLPPAPKRALSAYMHFCSAKRPEVSKSGKSLGEVSKALAALWAETSEADRKPFGDLAAAGKEAYQTEKAAWEEECRKIQGTKGKKKAVKSNDGGPSPPKRAKTAYLYFCEAKRQEVSQRLHKLGDISKELARQWAETTDRAEYIKLAEADKSRYEAEKSQRQSGSSSAPANGTSSRSKVKGSANGRRSRVLKVQRPSTKKTSKRVSAYMIFCRENRGGIVDENGEKLPLGETTKRLAERWKSIDPEEKATYEATAAEEKAKIMASC